MIINGGVPRPDTKTHAFSFPHNNFRVPHTIQLCFSGEGGCWWTLIELEKVPFLSPQILLTSTNTTVGRVWPPKSLIMGLICIWNHRALWLCFAPICDLCARFAWKKDWLIDSNNAGWRNRNQTQRKPPIHSPHFSQTFCLNEPQFVN